MRKLLTVLGKIGLAVLGCFVIFAAVSIAPVDTAPWTQSALKSALETALQSLKTQTNVVTGQLKAGFGRAKLTPALGGETDDPEQGRFRALPLAGYGARQGRPATGVHDDLWAKAIAIAVNGRTGILVSADALIIPRDVAEAVTERLKLRGLERGNLYFGATHTHSSIGGWGRGFVAEAFAGRFVPASPAWLARQLTAAAETALDDLSPASAGTAFFISTNHVRNRLVGSAGSIDPNFRIITLVQADGDRAVIGTYSAHATVLPSSVMEFSGDYPGAWATYMEKNNCALAMFFAGGVGSHAPRASAQGWEGVTRMGTELGQLTSKALEATSLTNHVSFGLVTLSLKLPSLQVRLTDSLKLRPWLARLFLPVQGETLVQALKLNEALWLSTPCDFSGELALQEVIPAERRHTMAVTSFNGDYVGYVIPSAYYHMSGYEPRTMSFFGPQLPEYMAAALRELSRLML